MNGLRIALYALAVFSSGACALLLFRGYVRRRIRLLLWSGICFIGLTISNIALFVDLVMFPELDLRLTRLIPALIGMTLLLCAFIWDSE